MAEIPKTIEAWVCRCGHIIDFASAIPDPPPCVCGRTEAVRHVYVLAEATDEMVAEAWRDGYDAAARMVDTAASVVGGLDGRVIAGVGRTLAQVRDDAEEMARERREAGSDARSTTRVEGDGA